MSAGGGALRHLDVELARLASAGLLRVPPQLPGGALILCSNDYLGYASEPLQGTDAPAGAGASRLVSGDHSEHRRAEAALSGWVGCQAALLYPSGYAANLGVIAALAGPGDLVVSDRLNHASIIDACRLSGAKIVVVEHCTLSAVEAALSAAQAFRRRWVVTETYFSMDGDSPDLRGLRLACDRYDAALVVDEAHALGVFGPEGAGLCAEARIHPDVLVGTLGKAVGLQGAFVAGSDSLRAWLWNRSRSFVFSTGLSPALAAAVAGRVARVAADDAGRARLDAVARELRALVGAASRSPLSTTARGPVIPWILGTAEAALAASDRLREAGVIVHPIRPPTVPAGTARLRVTATACLCDEDLRRVARAFRCFT